MGHDDNGQMIGFVHDFQQIENRLRVFHIQISCGFVKKKDLRFLSQRPGDHHPFFFPAAQVGHVPAGQRKRACCLHGLPGNGKIFFPFELQFSQVRRPAHEDGFLYSEREQVGRILGHKGNGPGQDVSPDLPDIRSLDGNRSLLRRKNPVADPQKCRFPRSVGSYHPQKFSPRHSAGDVPKHALGFLAITETDVFKIQNDHGRNRPLRSRYRK
nr:hypothetical protein [Syntrophus aciditrophicus]